VWKGGTNLSKILIVEDDAEIAMLEKDYMEINGFGAEIITDGKRALAALQKGGYDLVLLDLMLPGENGYDICRQIRDKINIPILMVTARTESADKILGLGLGADDYIAKPFDPAELVARVKSHLSRYQRLTGFGNNEEEDKIVGDLKIMPKGWKVFKGETEIKLPNR
jgi:DNA-binding response OmpR family regulator